MTLAFSSLSDYQDRLSAIKQRVVSARLRVALAANSELNVLYYEIGAQSIEREPHARWGSGFIDAFSKDLRETFPEVGGFSVKNLRYCRAFLRFCCDPTIWQQAVAKLPDNLKGALPTVEGWFFTKYWIQRARKLLEYHWSSPEIIFPQQRPSSRYRMGLKLILTARSCRWGSKNE